MTKNPQSNKKAHASNVHVCFCSHDALAHALQPVFYILTCKNLTNKQIFKRAYIGDSLAKEAYSSLQRLI